MFKYFETGNLFVALDTDTVVLGNKRIKPGRLLNISDIVESATPSARCWHMYYRLHQLGLWV